MGLDLTNFDVAERRRVHLRLSESTRQAATMEDAARGVCQVLYDDLEAPGSSGVQRASVLVRCFKSHPFGQLEPELQAYAASQMGEERPTPALRCMTLLASVGDKPEWCSRHTSQRFKCTPLSRETLPRTAMWGNLFKQCGMEVPGLEGGAEARFDDEFIDRTHHSYSVFCVEQALGSPSVIDQDNFVIPYGIASVLGFGGQLRRGDVYSVVLFSRVPISREVATQVNVLALDVTSTFFRYGDDEVFARPS
jgi:hypothetical protein